MHSVLTASLSILDSAIEFKKREIIESQVTPTPPDELIVNPPGHLEFTKAQLAVVSNLSELHKAHVLHHWRLVGISIIIQEVKHADANTVANCHLCNHPFRNLYEITESGDEEKMLFSTVTRKHQIEADRIIGGIGNAAAVTMLQDALLSTALYVV